MERLAIGEQRLEIGDERLAGSRKPGGDLSLVASKNQLEARSGGWALLKQAMVKHLPKRDVFNAVLISVAKSFADLNFKQLGDQDREYLVNELTDNIIKHYPSVRLSEIPDAFKLGIRGKYGEFYGLSVVTFERFVEHYLLSEKRTEMVKELPADDDDPKVPDMRTQFVTHTENALRALKLKTEGKDISVIAPSVYYFLDRIGLMAFTRIEKYDMLADAVRELIAELKLKLMIALPAERAVIKKDLEAYTLSITQHTAVDDRLKNLAKARAKKLALDAFLNNVLMEDTNLRELMESRKEVFMEG